MVLIVLGAVLYAAVARSLAAQSAAQLHERIASLQVKAQLAAGAFDPYVNIPIAVTTDPAKLGVTFGGPASGTIAIAVDPFNGGSVTGSRTQPAPTPDSTGSAANGPAPPGGQPAILPLPSDDEVAAARNGQETINETDWNGTPVRTLTAALSVGTGQVVIQIVADRTSEVRTLQVLVAALVIGGLLVIAASVVVGYVYAGGALVPIRESLRRQREFAADASHELRTPLAIVRAAVDQLRRNRGNAEVVDRSLDDITAGADRLNRLVDDLLLLARTDADAVELAVRPTDLADAASEAVGRLASVAGSRGVRLRLDVEPADVAGDAERLRQLVAILVDNAIRHSADGGAVDVSVRRDGSTAVVDVEDRGPGIRPEDLPHVFDRFWRAADAPPDGTGLGLAIARWIADRHRGRVTVENRPEGGARFRFSMPASN